MIFEERQASIPQDRVVLYSIPKMQAESLFKTRRKRLIAELQDRIDLHKHESVVASYERALPLVPSVTFGEVHHLKGLRSRFVIESYAGDEKLGERLIQFDQSL